MFFNKKKDETSQPTTNSGSLPSQAYIIAEIIKGCKYDSYLELGIYHGATFNYIKPFIKRCVGVDIEKKDFIPKDSFYLMTTDEFFNKNKEKFDAIFIDAAHEFAQVKKDFDNSMGALKKGGVVFLHDTDPYSKEYMGPTFCDDAYRMNQYLEEKGIYQFVTIPMDETGLTLVRKKKDNRFEKFV
jgi:hypothetical protein